MSSFLQVRFLYAKCGRAGVRVTLCDSGWTVLDHHSRGLTYIIDNMATQNLVLLIKFLDHGGEPTSKTGEESSSGF